MMVNYYGNEVINTAQCRRFYRASTSMANAATIIVGLLSNVVTTRILLIPLADPARPSGRGQHFLPKSEIYFLDVDKILVPTSTISDDLF